jgi:general secretion pathway protein G
VAPAGLRQLGGARLSVAKQSIERTASVLDMYKLDAGSHPSTEQRIRALVERAVGVDTWTGLYLKSIVPQDPWSHDYTYRNP